ncbi:MAG: arylesterase [Salinisphaeraceae bacterium]|nr:arylesterase [Salinisphaeraceae bacterium]
MLSPAAQAASTAPTILVTGDSLSAAYGIPLEQGWVALLQKRLEQKGYPYTVVNTSVSGETTAGGLGRLGKELQQYKPDLVIIELGANDGLRGLSLKQMHKNLQAMIEQSRAADAEVLLLGMRLPSNYGQAYTEQFHQTFKDVAEQTKVPLVPFLLEGIALDRSMFQDDGVHPTAKAQPALLERVWTKLEEMLQPTAQVAQE